MDFDGSRDGPPLGACLDHRLGLERYLVLGKALAEHVSHRPRLQAGSGLVVARHGVGPVEVGVDGAS